MDKKQAIRILSSAAKLYEENLEDQKVLFLYGTPKVIRQQMMTKDSILSKMQYYEVTFYRKNFLHLTGIQPNRKVIKSAIHFYEKCKASRLQESDFTFSKDGSSVQKLEILQNMMQIKKIANMIGDFTDYGPKLFSEKVAGNTCGCMGFVCDNNAHLNVPNTLLQKDIRDVSAIPTMKIYATLSKNYNDLHYSKVDRQDKGYEVFQYHYAKEIENLLHRQL